MEVFYQIMGRNDWEKSKAGTSPASGFYSDADLLLHVAPRLSENLTPWARSAESNFSSLLKIW